MYPKSPFDPMNAWLELVAMGCPTLMFLAGMMALIFYAISHAGKDGGSQDKHRESRGEGPTPGPEE